MIKDVRESCDTCDKRFARKDELDQHKKIEHHNGAMKKSYRCSHCGKVFQKILHVREHKRKNHFETEHNKLTSVLRKYNTGDTFETCVDADAFKQEKTVNHEKHELLTTKLSCSWCGNNFNINSDILEHIESSHKSRESENGGILLVNLQGGDC